MYILVAGLLLFAVLLQTLPFSGKENMGLALLVFISILWLTEAVHVTITALLVPIMGVGMGMMNVVKVGFWLNILCVLVVTLFAWFIWR